MIINFRNLTLLFCLILVTGCASGAQTTSMVAYPEDINTVNKDSRFYGKISIKEITGGKETNPLWTSQVDNMAFRTALESSLKANGLLGNGNTRYELSANLLELKQPIIGFNFSVYSNVNYVLDDTTKKKNIISKDIGVNGTASMDDAFLGVERLRIANERSIKENIGTFIEELRLYE